MGCHRYIDCRGQSKHACEQRFPTTLWLNIIAAAKKKKPNTGIKELLLEHYGKYGHSYSS